MKKEIFRSFGRCESSESFGLRPASIPEVQQAFGRASAAKQRVTLRGGGHSFDGQAIQADDGKQLILLTDGFNEIQFSKDSSSVTVGAGVTWDTILRKCLSRNPPRIPWVVQTGRRATAGGTLAGDVLSRFSRRESVCIESFDFVPVVGECMRCSRTENSNVFHAVIGGLGYLGFVPSITYRLLPIGPNYRARTDVEVHDDLEELIKAQIVYTSEARAAERRAKILSENRTMEAGLTVETTEALQAVSSAEFTHLLFPNRVKGAVFRSTYAPASGLPEFPLYNRLDSDDRHFTELNVRRDFMNRLIHEGGYLYCSVFKHFENDIHDFTFFMDGNTFAKERFEKENPPKLFPIVQQTFVVAEDRIVEFGHLCVQMLRAAGLHPTELDILFVNEDDCLMSANRGFPGFALSIAFENFDHTDCTPPAIQTFFYDLSRICLERFGGRIHLVKNVHAEKKVLRKMFRGGIEEFEDLKRRFDPQGLLRNPFFDRLFNFR
jgi:decaprenylphospho-beta-D-ribofuranose 2-oxidase